MSVIILAFSQNGPLNQLLSNISTPLVVHPYLPKDKSFTVLWGLGRRAYCSLYFLIYTCMYLIINQQKMNIADERRKRFLCMFPFYKDRLSGEKFVLFLSRKFVSVSNKLLLCALLSEFHHFFTLYTFVVL